MRARLALAAVLSALTCAAAITLMGTSAWLIARAAQHPSAGALTLAAVAVRALGLSRALLRYGERLVGHDAVLRLVAELRAQVFDALQRSGDRVSAGEDVSVLVSDVEAVQDLWLRGVLPVAAGLLVGLATVAATWWVLPAAGLVLLIGLGSALAVLPLLAWSTSGRDAHVAAARAERQAAVVDVLHGCGELLVYGGVETATSRARSAVALVSGLERRAVRRTALASGLGAGLQGGTALVIALVGAQAVSRGALAPVWLGVLVLVALASFEPASSVWEAAGVARLTAGGLARVRKVLAEAAPPPGPGIPDATGGALHVHGLDYTYPGRTRPALHLLDLDLVLAPGTVVGVVGGSGAGKSTLLRLLSGELSGGSVTTVGMELTWLTPEQRSRVVAVAAQDAHVFDASLADNLRIARPHATSDELARALQVVGLADWAEGLQDRWYTPLGHRGVRMSGGQRKRLCVARAWLADTPVLLLDEPTEGLDPVAADLLVRSVLAASRDRAVVLVTHRVVPLVDLPTVLVLDHGRLVQRGAATVLAREPGLFAEAWRLQSAADEPGCARAAEQERSHSAGVRAQGFAPLCRTEW